MNIRRAIFGRKPSAPAEPMRPAQPPAGKIFDDSLFEGKTGEFLRSAGFHPDDPRNNAANAQPLAALLAEDSARLRRMLDEVNALIPARLAPLQLVPVEVWRGRYGAWLRQTLGLSPYTPWNTIFLAADAQAVAEYGLPLATEPRAPQLVEAASEIVGSVHDHLAGSTDGATQAMVSLLTSLRQNLPELLPPDRGDFSGLVREGRALVRAAAIATCVTAGFPGVDVIRRAHALALAEPEIQLVA